MTTVPYMSAEDMVSEIEIVAASLLNRNGPPPDRSAALGAVLRAGIAVEDVAEGDPLPLRDALLLLAAICLRAAILVDAEARGAPRAGLSLVGG